MTVFKKGSRVAACKGSYRTGKLKAIKVGSAGSYGQARRQEQHLGVLEVTLPQKRKRETAFTER